MHRIRLVSFCSRGTLMSYGDHSAQRCFKSNAHIVSSGLTHVGPAWKQRTKLSGPHISLLAGSVLLAVSDVKDFCSGEKELEKEGYEPDDSVLRGRLNNTDYLEKLAAALVHLPPSQSVDLISLLQRFPELFGDTPTRTD